MNFKCVSGDMNRQRMVFGGIGISRPKGMCNTLNIESNIVILLEVFFVIAI